MDNIDKKEFNESFGYYITLTEKPAADRYYTTHIHKPVQAIIYNATYHHRFAFDDQRFTYEDTEAELIYNLQAKKDKITKYKGVGNNYYNLVFTVCRNKFFDMLRSNKTEEELRSKLSELVRDSLRQQAADDDEIFIEPEQ